MESLAAVGLFAVLAMAVWALVEWRRAKARDATDEARADASAQRAGGKGEE